MLRISPNFLMEITFSMSAPDECVGNWAWLSSLYAPELTCVRTLHDPILYRGSGQNRNDTRNISDRQGELGAKKHKLSLIVFWTPCSGITSVLSTPYIDNQLTTSIDCRYSIVWLLRYLPTYTVISRLSRLF